MLNFYWLLKEFKMIDISKSYSPIVLEYNTSDRESPLYDFTQTLVSHLHITVLEKILNGTDFNHEIRTFELKIKELNRQNNLLSNKYNNDPKYARIHKRLLERGNISKRESKIFEALEGVKIDADKKVLSNTDMLNNESYFERMMIFNVIKRFKDEQKIELNADATKYINKLLYYSYINITKKVLI